MTARRSYCRHGLRFPWLRVEGVGLTVIARRHTSSWVLVEDNAETTGPGVGRCDRQGVSALGRSGNPGGDG